MKKRNYRRIIVEIICIVLARTNVRLRSASSFTEDLNQSHNGKMKHHQVSSVHVQAHYCETYGLYPLGRYIDGSLHYHLP